MINYLQFLVATDNFKIETLGSNLQVGSIEGRDDTPEDRLVGVLTVDQDVRFCFESEVFSYSTIFGLSVNFNGFAEGTGDYIDQDPYPTTIFDDGFILYNRPSSLKNSHNVYLSQLIMTNEQLADNPQLQNILSYQGSLDGCIVRDTKYNGEDAKEFLIDFSKLDCPATSLVEFDISLRLSLLNHLNKTLVEPRSRYLRTELLLDSRKTVVDTLSSMNGLFGFNPLTLKETALDSLKQIQQMMRH